MKALILAAGLGTRLLPFSQHSPKPLFTLNQRPVLDLIVDQLHRAGCSAVIINTHHHHEQIEAYIAGRRYPLPVTTRHEPDILGTGGAIRNVADFWPNEPLLIINADIVTDIDLRQVYRFHQEHPFAVTMVMHDHAQFNAVFVDAKDFVIGFDTTQASPPDCRILAFTGIHVLNRRVLDFLPPQGPAHIIAAYGRMLQAGERIKAMIVRDHYWRDIGTPPSYQAAAVDHMAPLAFEKGFGQRPQRQAIGDTKLKGDGSDRQWHRLTAGQNSLIMVDHGIRSQLQGPIEVDAFVDIGTHLHAKGLPVPRIYLHDRFSGLVFLEDLGDRHLQDAVRNQAMSQVQCRYQQVIDQWLPMAFGGADGFDVRWTYQSTHYDRELILERECRYFVEAFVSGYLNRSIAFSDLAPEFQWLADRVMENGVMGFMHRDLQSRNIMIKDQHVWFIDFQGGRIGPLQYDLASLLIDPYVALPVDLQHQLCQYAVQALGKLLPIDPNRFLRGYAFCAITRNLQMLGAFGFLSRVKGKTDFETYIPTALETLRRNLFIQPDNTLPKLTALVKEIALHIQK